MSNPEYPTTSTPSVDALRARTADLPLTVPGADALSGLTLVMSGGSRGIGLEIALAAARHGANIAMLAKTAEPDPRIPGTIFSAAAAIEAAGGRALPVVGDVRDDDDVARVVDRAVEVFGGVDIVVNNASAINLHPTVELPMKRLDLMLDINIRGTFALTRAALPHLLDSGHGHILTLSPPLNTDTWIGNFPAYAVGKYGMSVLALGWAGEFAGRVSSNALWPETTIATAAVKNTDGLGGDESVRHSRGPEIMADAALAVLATAPGAVTGHTLVDADVMRATGMADLSGYGGEEPLTLDLFL
ncbi:SDR family oxidoreductase [uncultured Corynebacterium sp.]|uniref:SDR family oxidoreductase n=1 Tax=uncultured Corynebacterium sp. TaxID=159447 RepID=UPI0025F292DC|nr:SDR family oxidoreductase [uncultured Corynebacterium sp.]